MRPTRVLLAVCGAAGTLSVLAALISADRTAAQCALAASAALIGYVLFAGPAAPRVRPALAAGIALLAVPASVELWRDSTAPVRRQTLAPLYTPLDGSVASTGPARLPQSVLDQWRQSLDERQFACVGLLLGVVCLAVAVRALPAQQRPKATALAGAGAVLMMVFVGADAWSRVDDEPLLGLLGAGWPALLATLAAARMLALSGPRADRAALVPIGALLVAVSAAAAFQDLTGRWAAWWTFSHPDDNVVVSVGVAVSLANVVDGEAALLAAVALAGPALLAVGVLRAGRTAAAVPPAYPPGP
ncbi:hypothetical protein O7626_29425 [Micromonospora sp. WMMD1102]|uniref:hypothetical protein n=1 Tax=Micromonospora sp. WMMD1102 TaxID=3016105 RepID=UPI002414DE0B|nr:hypothetical protein [Micromonospora sp. WMMD1102]MDG4789995.1 hypothetical protein [Micromonospora sp. WMMD1102]